jgi:predicted O-linked N-acetylglucosamine transferase (SPINDLY family)
MLRPQQLLFRAGTLCAYMRALARAGERLFTLDGFPLPCRFPERTVDRLRIGVIVRNWESNPERRIAEATIQGLDPQRFEPILILMSEPGGEEPAGTVSIAGLPVTHAVDHIRGLGLDVLVLGSFFLRFDTLAALVSHKLAPLQIATAAVSPVTTGLSSFDAILTSDLIEPADAADHYVEPVVSVAGPIQSFAASTVEAAGRTETRDETRARLGLPVDAVLLVSGAMMQKIGSDLLDAWASVLAAAPGTCLVLYPFALNWSIDFAAAAFRDAALAALAARNVAADRLTILDPLEPEDVRALLRAADVYLDSFPYAGAATVTEALEEGLPVVSLLGDTQRGRQGAGWLRAFGLDDDIADAVDAYIARATALATGAGLRAERRALIAERNAAGPPHLDARGTAGRFGDAVADLAAGKGVTLRPRR